MLLHKKDDEKDRSIFWSTALFFDWEQERSHHVQTWTWLLLIYIGGLLLWGGLFNWGRTPLNYHDWEEINLPRFDAIRDAIDYRMLPLHVKCEHCLHQLTDRFLVLPDVVTTPQMLLMALIDVDTFALVDLLIHYTVATLGLMYLRQKFRLSLMAYAYIFLLFNFNGYIQAHYVVGHITWGGYFLFPWYFALLFRLFDAGPSWGWVSGMALLSLYVVLTGSQHHFIWLMLFLVTLALIYRRSAWWIMTAVVFSGLLSAIRLLPPALALKTFTSNFSFFTGYHTLYDFIAALMIRHPFDYVVKFSSVPIGYWEYDYFVGVVGVIFIGYFGILKLLRDPDQPAHFYYLLFPAMVVFLFSQGHIYEYTLYRLPLFSSERVTSRMVSLPVTFFILASAVYFQKFLDQNRAPLTRWLAGGGLVMLLSEIGMHIELWRVDKIAPFLKPREMQFPGNSIVNHSDPQYLFMIYAGLALTLTTALLLAILTRREKRMKGS